MKDDILLRLAKEYCSVSRGTALTTPTLLVLTDNQYWEYFEALTPEVRRTYLTKGFYTVTKDSTGTMRLLETGVQALHYKGVPTITQNSFECLRDVLKRDISSDLVMRLRY